MLFFLLLYINYNQPKFFLVSPFYPLPSPLPLSFRPVRLISVTSDANEATFHVALAITAIVLI